MTPVQLHKTIHILEHLKLIWHRTHVFRNFLLWQCQF